MHFKIQRLDSKLLSLRLHCFNIKIGHVMPENSQKYMFNTNKNIQLKQKLLTFIYTI